MPEDFHAFLAASVLNDGQIVSYRSLSRELKVHSNAAKKMLYEFHQSQKIKKTTLTYATYLVDGTPRITEEQTANGHQQDGGDAHMQSSPFMSSSMPHEENDENMFGSRSIMLAREDDLEAAKNTFARIHSIHIYSLGPSSVKNLQVISECNRAIYANHAHEDPLEIGEKYGVIHNTGVRRRSGRRPGIVSTSVPAANIESKASSKTPDVSKAGTSTVKPTDRPSSSGDATKKPVSKPAKPKREQSDLFKSFSKPKVKLKMEDSGSSAGASPPAATANSQDVEQSREDEKMKDASEDEYEEAFPEPNKAKPRIGKSKSERAEQLRRMMEVEDEVMEDKSEDTISTPQELEPIDTPTSQTEVSPELPVVVTGGRRRGRRKVMKKKTVKDDEGYLVTKEELAWESFSEDDLPQKGRISASAAPLSIAKGKKSAGKPGQGNIMNFFGKK